jgi:hypothetical protein
MAKAGSNKHGGGICGRRLWRVYYVHSRIERLVHESASARSRLVLRLRAGSKVDAFRALRAALKVLGRRFGLRAISVTAEQASPGRAA